MSKSPEALRAMARQVRDAIAREADPEVRRLMEQIAEGYEKLAEKRQRNGQHGDPA